MNHVTAPDLAYVQRSTCCSSAVALQRPPHRGPPIILKIGNEINVILTLNIETVAAAKLFKASSMMAGRITLSSLGPLQLGPPLQHLAVVVSEH